MKETPIIKQVRSQVDGQLKDFTLTKKEIFEDKNGKRKSITSWTQTHGEMENGAPEVIQFVCSVPKGYTNINYETLNTECLYSEAKPNENALVK